jgi:hypothetical protein
MRLIACLLIAAGLWADTSMAQDNCASGGCGEPTHVGLGRITGGEARDDKVAVRKSNPTGTVSAPGTGTRTENTGNPPTPPSQ